MKNFDKFDKACKQCGLSNIDQALLLDVVPGMIPRYRKGTASMPGPKWEAKSKIAIRSLKAAVKSVGRSDFLVLPPRDRFKLLEKSLHEAGALQSRQV